MKQTILAIMLLFFMSPIFAQRHADMDGLSEVQRAEIQRQIAITKEQNNKKASTQMEVPAAPPVERVSTWVEAGVNLGKGLAAVAKELGVAANDFVKTPVGKLTAAVILYKFMGKDVVKIIVGFLFIVVFGSTWIYIFRRICLIDRIVVGEDVKDGRKLTRREVIYGAKYATVGDGTKFMLFIAAILIPATGLIIILA